MSDTMKFNTQEPPWAQWNWSDTGPGHWHVIAAVGLGVEVDADGSPQAIQTLVQTACGSTRPRPSSTAAEPGEPVCEACAKLDGLRKNGAEEREPEKAPVLAKQQEGFVN